MTTPKRKTRAILTRDEARDIKECLKTYSMNDVIEMSGWSKSTVYRVSLMTDDKINALGSKDKKRKPVKINRVKPAEIEQAIDDTKPLPDKVDSIIESSPIISMEELERACEPAEKPVVIAKEPEPLTIKLEDLEGDKFNYDEELENYLLSKYSLERFLAEKRPFTCGLVGGRHDVPVKSYIFRSSLSESIMFDFKKQREEVAKFFNNFNVERSSKVKLYATGLQSVLCSVVSECVDRKINLSVMHYNARTRNWWEQPVLEFGEKEDSSDWTVSKYQKLRKGSNLATKSFYEHCRDEVIFVLKIRTGSNYIQIFCTEDEAENLFLSMIADKKFREEKGYSFFLTQIAFVGETMIEKDHMTFSISKS